jgi:hypothetical protein
MPIDTAAPIQCSILRIDDKERYKIVIRCPNRDDIVLLEFDPEQKMPPFITLPVGR